MQCYQTRWSSHLYFLPSCMLCDPTLFGWFGPHRLLLFFYKEHFKKTNRVKWICFLIELIGFNLFAIGSYNNPSSIPVLISFDRLHVTFDLDFGTNKLSKHITSLLFLLFLNWSRSKTFQRANATTDVPVASRPPFPALKNTIQYIPSLSVCTSQPLQPLQPHISQSVSQCLYLATLATTSQSVRLSVFIPRNLCNPCNHVSVSPSLSVYTSQPLQPLQPRLSQSVSQCLYLATSATLATTSQSVRLSVFIPRNLCNPCNHASVSPSLSVYTSQPLQPLQPRISQSVSQCLYLATSATLATTSQSVRLSVFVPRNLCNPCNHVSVSPSLGVCTSQPLQPLQPRLSQSVSQCLYLATSATLATTSQSVRLSVFVPRNLCNPCNHVSVSPSLSVCTSQPLQSLQPRLSQSVSQCLYLATSAILATTSQSVRLSVFVSRNFCNPCNHISVSPSLCVCISQPLQPLKLRLSEYSSLEKGNLFEAFPKKVYLVYLLTCKSAFVARRGSFNDMLFFPFFSPATRPLFFSVSLFFMVCIFCNLCNGNKVTSQSVKAFQELHADSHLASLWHWALEQLSNCQFSLYLYCYLFPFLFFTCISTCRLTQRL